MPEETSATFKGLDRASPPIQAEPGACRVLEGAVLVPGRRGWSPAPTANEPGLRGYLSLARQAEENGGRLLVLESGSSDEVIGVDDDTFSQTALFTLTGGDSSRELHAASVTQDTFVATTAGPGIGDPETLRVLRGDTVTELPWPDPPTFDVTWQERSGDTFTEPGRYVLRVAWRLEDGTIGPASGPYLTETPNAGDDVRFEAQVEITGYPDGKPSGGWADRVEGLVLIVHPAASTTSATDVSAPDVPGYRVGGFEQIPPVGDKTTWSDPLEGIIASETHDTRTLVHHSITAGALFSYNRRLIMGDVVYDYEEPLLSYMIKGADGGTDLHLSMRVTIETNQGTFIRYADPIGFSSSAAASVELRQGLIFYRDRRAKSYDWIVADDYTGDFDAATWTKVAVSAPSEFSAANSANFAYVEPDRQTIDLTTVAVNQTDVTSSSAWTDGLDSDASAFDTQQGSGQSSDSPNNATYDAEAQTLAAEEDLAEVLVRYDLVVAEDTDGGGYGSAEGKITVSVENGSGTTLESSETKVRDTDGITSGVIELDSFDEAAAEVVRVKTEASASATANGGTATFSATAEATEVDLVVADKSAGDTQSTNRSTTSAEVDRDGNRMVWSEALRPLDLPVENVAYVGTDESDPILAFASNAAPISEGQYGDYPILVFGRESVWSVQVGADPFVQGLSPVAPNLGLVGRSAIANANGPIYAATTRGIARFTPSLDGYVSTELHDGSFVSSLGPETECAYYTNENGRREVWVTGGDATYVWSLVGSAWSTLPINRETFTRVEDRVFSLEGGTLYEEGEGSGTYQVTIETAPLYLGAPSSLKSVRDVWLMQGEPPPEARDQFLHARSIGETAKGLDYTTDLTEALHLRRGLVRALSVWVRAGDPSAVLLVGIGVRYELRDPTAPRTTVSDSGKLLGAGAVQSDLDNDLNW